MQRLILLRHAKTEPRSEAGDDLSRRLTERGRNESAVMACVLDGAGYAPDLVLVSPAARTRETWDWMAATFPKAKVELRKALYDATPEEIEGEMGQGTAAAATVMVVAHNPGLQELAVNLLVDGGGSHSDIERLSAGFPTAAAAVFAIDEAGRGHLEALFHARDHREVL
ncbi:MAG: histidine phosphatase family protein [Caulobacteraceae bacterium]|jgi:phosphohistidine phosphatase